MTKDKPYWLPDTQGFLAVAIILIIATVTLILLTSPPLIDERTSGVLMTVVGVLIACLKDVYSFFFGSSRGSEKKDDAMIAGNLAPTPTPPVSTTTTVEPDKTVTKTEPVMMPPAEPKGP